MTYIELFNKFWLLDEDWQFTCCETRLYFYLLKTANRLGWVDSWTRSDAKVSSDVGVSINSMKTARNRLVQSGLITFKSGGKGQRDKTRYQISYQNLIPKPQPNLIPKPQPKVEPSTYNVRVEDINKDIKRESIPPISPEEVATGSFLANLVEVKAKLLNDEIWKENACLQSGLSIRFLSLIPEQIGNFFSWIQATGEEKTILTLEDAKRRFIYWWKYTGLKEWKQNAKNNERNRKNISNSTVSLSINAAGADESNFDSTPADFEKFYNSLSIGR